MHIMKQAKLCRSKRLVQINKIIEIRSGHLLINQLFYIISSLNIKLQVPEILFQNYQKIYNSQRELLMLNNLISSNNKTEQNK